MLMSFQTISFINYGLSELSVYTSSVAVPHQKSSAQLWTVSDDTAPHTFEPVLPFSKSKFLIFVIKISLNSLDCIRYFLENSLKFH
jgi:hypothetical protein